MKHDKGAELCVNDYTVIYREIMKITRTHPLNEILYGDGPEDEAMFNLNKKLNEVITQDVNLQEASGWLRYTGKYEDRLPCFKDKVKLIKERVISEQGEDKVYDYLLGLI
jgi:hypothetical protein